MILCLSRARKNDISLDRATEAARYRKRHCGARTPNIFTAETLLSDPQGTATAYEIELPELHDRQALNAQDPLSSVHHYLVIMYVVIPAAFGLRMCFNCPDCNVDETDRRTDRSLCSCQDLMGSNAKLQGGYAGIAESCAFAHEFQGDGTPHGHGFVSLANAYQHATLDDIAALIKSNVHNLSPDDMIERIKAFKQHVEREDHFDNDGHQNNLSQLEKEFHANNSGPQRNIFLSVRPRFFYTAAGKPYLWKR